MKYNSKTATVSIDEVMAEEAVRKFLHLVRETNQQDVETNLWLAWASNPQETFINLISRFNHLRSTTNGN